MPVGKLTAALSSLVACLDQMGQLAAAAHQWASMSLPVGVPQFERLHLEIVTEIAFLRAFTAWEAFLEESFILYLWGKTAPAGTRPKRIVCPRTREIAKQIVVPEGRRYADWSKYDIVIARAKRYFDGGGPYLTAMQKQNSELMDVQTIRNAIVHSSTFSRENFESLVRRELGTLPAGLAIGGFLSMTVPPASPTGNRLPASPPRSYLECYFDVIQLVADGIVPP